MEFQMALDNFNAAVANLETAADNLIAKASADAAALAQAQSDLANADAAATAAIQPVIDKLNAA
jgi:multidrug resistance efflux pump